MRCSSSGRLLSPLRPIPELLASSVRSLRRPLAHLLALLLLLLLFLQLILKLVRNQMVVRLRLENTILADGAFVNVELGKLTGLLQSIPFLIEIS